MGAVVTEEMTRRIISEETWPMGQDVEDLGGLLKVFGCEHREDLEDVIAGRLPEDPGDIFIDDDFDSISVNSSGVLMWLLPYPFSAAVFDSYLFELDERMTVQKLLWELPDVDMWESEGEPSILPQLAQLFHTSPEEFCAALGDDWRPLDLDWVGSTSNPSNYLWTGTSVVALDNCHAYVFRSVATENPSGFVLDGEEYQEDGWFEDIWQDGGPSLAWFAPFVLE